MKVVALAGGVGGAKLVDGLAAVLAPEDLTVVVNTGDDFRQLNPGEVRVIFKIRPTSITAE